MEQRMRIAMVSETYPPEVNGVARTVALMAEGLHALGHEIQLVRPRQGPAERALDEPRFRELLRPGIRIPRYPQLRMGLPSRGALLQAWKKARPEVVHIATEGPLGSSALSAARALAIPVATDFHTNFHAYSGHYGFPWLERAVAAYLRRFHNRADCTMVPTDEMAQDLARLGFEKLRVVGRGVNSAVFSPAKRRAELRAEWGADDDTPVALCVSRFAPEKNFPLVLDAYRAMRAVRPETRLVLVGDGPMTEELKREHLGCVVAGRLVNGELSAHYASADIFLFPSTSETFGNVTMEAMASGLAVVAYDYAAARQHIVHGRSGLLARVDDRISFIEHAAALARDLPRARTLGRQARATAEPLGWDRVVADFASVLADTMTAPGSAMRESHAAA
ncbi:MAG TPA: glycosyltransferase family 1 protein [Burkholderiales bacterium]|nr:glycosyltransferase family 1 protein [Burkholderiales bacterium]